MFWNIYIIIKIRFHERLKEKFVEDRGWEIRELDKCDLDKFFKIFLNNRKSNILKIMRIYFAYSFYEYVKMFIKN